MGAEPFPPPLRKKLFEEGVDVVQMYGIAEVGCIAYETIDSKNNLVNGMLIEEDIILEIVRPGTSYSLPPGEVGEIVITKLNSDYPMIRLGTGDLSKIIVDLFLINNCFIIFFTFLIFEDSIIKNTNQIQ